MDTKKKSILAGKKQNGSNDDKKKVKARRIISLQTQTSDVKHKSSTKITSKSKLSIKGRKRNIGSGDAAGSTCINPKLKAARVDRNKEESETGSGDQKRGKLNVERKSNIKYVYRILRPGESYKYGLYPKDIQSRISIQQHVERGSRCQKSKYISCCRRLCAIKRLGKFTYDTSQVRDVLRITIGRLKNNVQVIDLTKVEIRERHIERSSKAWGYSERSEEVILEPTSHVPPECLKKIGEIRYKLFRKI
ncbi:uncharacterized protein LOC134253684 isoform X2 [Saccostrea cucullata]